MSLRIEPGRRLFSAVCETELIAIKATDTEVELTIGGRPPLDTPRDGQGLVEVLAGHDGGTLIGKRYVDAAGTVELLCTKPGEGVPALDGVILQLKESKALPSSD